LGFYGDFIAWLKPGQLCQLCGNVIEPKGCDLTNSEWGKKPHTEMHCVLRFFLASPCSFPVHGEACLLRFFLASPCSFLSLWVRNRAPFKKRVLWSTIREFLYFYFFSIGVWTQGLHLESFHQSFFVIFFSR
jgi:hypothetical protein